MWPAGYTLALCPALLAWLLSDNPRCGRRRRASAVWYRRQRAGPVTAIGLGTVGPLSVGLALPMGTPPSLPGVVRRGPGRWVAPNHVELLTHRPQVGSEPVEQHADREVDAADGEDQREHVQHDLLLLRERPGQRLGRHVLAHQLQLGDEQGRRHGDDQHQGDDVDAGDAVFETNLEEGVGRAGGEDGW